MQTTTTKPVTNLSQPLARLSLGAAVAELLFLVALYFLSPEFDPSWRMVSEYALGQYAWVIALMFASWALSSVTLFLAVRSQVRTQAGTVGLVLLLVSALGQSLAIVFDVSQPLHGLAAFLGIPTFPIAALLITKSLTQNHDWTTLRTPLWWTANLTWLSLLLMVAAMVIGLAQSGGDTELHKTVTFANFQK